MEKELNKTSEELVIKLTRTSFNHFLYCMFPIGYTIFGMLTVKCVFTVMGIMMGVFSHYRYPRLIPFCIIVGIFALAVCVILLAGNIFLLYNSKEKIRSRLIAEAGITLLLCPTFIAMWDITFAYLQVTF